MFQSRIRRLTQSSVFRVTSGSTFTLIVIRQNADRIIKAAAGGDQRKSDSEADDADGRSSTPNGNNVSNARSITPLSPALQRNLYQTALRCDLMGGAKEISLEKVRDWHHKNGYFGGVVVRKMDSIQRAHSGRKSQTTDDDSDNDSNDESLEPLSSSKQPSDSFRRSTLSLPPSFFDRISGESDSHRRECYYLYYDIDAFTGKKTYDIVLRGTMCWSDLMYNLKFQKKWDAELELYIHKGFLQKAELILEDLLVLLSHVSGGSKKTNNMINLSGHSLGGALAVIIACKLEKRGFNVNQVTTFGAPKFCTNYSQSGEVASLMQDLRFQYYNICDPDDLVTFLPTDGPVSYVRKGGYVSVNRVTVCDRDQASHAKNTPCTAAMAPNFQSQNLSPFLHWFERSFLLLPIQNPEAHRMRQYVRKLRPGDIQVNAEDSVKEDSNVFTQSHVSFTTVADTNPDRSQQSTDLHAPAVESGGVDAKSESASASSLTQLTSILRSFLSTNAQNDVLNQACGGRIAC